MSIHVTAAEARDLVACTAPYCRVNAGERCKSILGKPMEACHWQRAEDAEHVAELKAIVRNATKPTEYEETP